MGLLTSLRKQRFNHYTPSSVQFAPAMPEQATPLRQVVPSPVQTDLEQTERNLSHKHSIGASLARAWLTRSIKPFEFTNEYDHALSYQGVRSLGLYVHIPFCRSICAFCPYCKHPYQSETAKQYVQQLLREIDLVCGDHTKSTLENHSLSKKQAATSLYFGGGSPALLVDEIGAIINKLQEYFDITDGIGVELHPDDVTVETFKKLKTAGVTRISIGVQSFDSATLSILGRNHFDYSQVFETIQAVPFDTVAMDFIFALEGQTFESIKADIDTAFASGANHIALYPFIDFAFSKSNVKKMDKQQKKSLLYKIANYCMEQGYVRDSIWTFGKPGVDKYSSMTRDNFLGFGCSATSLLANQFKVNTFSPEAYEARINSGELPTALTTRFTKRQRMIYWLFWRLYTTHLHEQDFKDFFGEELNKMYGLELWLGTAFGMLKKKDGIYSLTNKGVFYYHHFEGYYTYKYIDHMWNIMRNEPFPKEVSI